MTRGAFVAGCYPLFTEGQEGPTSRIDSIPVTGAAVPELEPFDALLTKFVAEHQVPGAALALTRKGQLIYARGFGWADLASRRPVQPDSLFRIASLSKPVTAVAVLHLVERGQLSLDDRVLDHLRSVPALASEQPDDDRWKRITVLHCLQHTAGWDSSLSKDPIAQPRQIADALGMALPVQAIDVVRRILRQPLDFDPGERFAYSNVGYLILGRVIEAVSGIRYEDYVRTNIFRPLGLKAPRLGRAAQDLRADGEVTYYDVQQRTGAGVVPPVIGQEVPLQYGAENLDAFDAHGGWIASAVDLARFAAALDEPSRGTLLKESSLATMTRRPAGLAGNDTSGQPRETYYSCGWVIRQTDVQGALNQFHAGRIAGSGTLLVRRSDTLNWALLFNTDANKAGESLTNLVDPLLHQAASDVISWPM